MGLQSIWNDEGDYLNKKSKGFSARSTGCYCCTCQLDTEKKVRKEVLDSLSEILIASKYFKWNFKDLLKEASESEKLVEFNKE